MTVNSSSTRELDIDRLTKLAIQMAGVLPASAATSGVQWNNYAAQARDLLELNMDHMQTLGNFTRSVELYDIDVSSGDGDYDLPSTTMNVLGDAQFVLDGSTAGTFVRMITREEYLELSDREATGHPTLCYAQVHATITLFLWPVPDVAGTLTIQRQRLLADNDDGSKTLDVERHWYKPIMLELAHLIAVANTMPNDRCAYLQSLAEKAMDSSKRAATQSGGIVTVISHRTGWNR